MKKIRLLSAVHADCARQMALDEAVLISCSQGKSLPTLRFYGFNPPAITLGVHQEIKNFDMEKIQKKGFGLTRRITGGTAVLHQGDFVYSLIFPEADLPHDIVGAYKYLSDGLVRGLDHIGIRVSKRESESKKREDSCYLNNNPYDVVFEGRKISGNALTRLNGYLMEQGTLIIEDNIKDLLDCQNLSDDQKERLCVKARERVGCISETLGRIPSFSELEDSMRKGFASLFSQSDYILEAGELTAYENDLAEQLYKEKYSTIEWRNHR